MSRQTSITFLLGPSGVGKSTLGAWLAEDCDALHMEIDQYPSQDGIDAEGLREEWEAFLAGASAADLVAVIRRKISGANASGSVLSFPSGLVFSAGHLDSLAKARVIVVVLYGTAADCINAFLKREVEHRRVPAANLVEHWISNNRDSYVAFSRPEWAPFRVSAFREGKRVSRAKLVAEVRRRVGA